MSEIMEEISHGGSEDGQYYCDYNFFKETILISLSNIIVKKNLPWAGKVPFSPQPIIDNTLREVITLIILWRKLLSIDEQSKYNCLKLFNLPNSKRKKKLEVCKLTKSDQYDRQSYRFPKKLYLVGLLFHIPSMAYR